MEDQNRPRFELVDVRKEGASVWYNGELKPCLVPLLTFKRDCVNWWKIKQTPSTERPKWLHKNGVFMLSADSSIIVTAEIPDTKYSRRREIADVGNHPLRIRQVQWDFLSCTDTDTGHLFIIELWYVTKHGQAYSTIWDRIGGDKDILDDSSEIDWSRFNL
jgi:hypothetical protein